MIKEIYSSFFAKHPPYYQWLPLGNFLISSTERPKQNIVSSLTNVFGEKKKVFYGFRCNIHTERAIKFAVLGVGEVGNDKLRKYLISYSSCVYLLAIEENWVESETQLLNHECKWVAKISRTIYMKKKCVRETCQDNERRDLTITSCLVNS